MRQALPDPPPVARGTSAPAPGSRLESTAPYVVPPDIRGRRRRLGQVLGSAATYLVVATMLGLATKIVLMPTGFPGAPWQHHSSSQTSTSANPAGTGASGASPSAGPAGSAMPRGDLPGWHQTFADDFTGNLFDQWGTYEGQPGGDPGGWFDKSHVHVQNGVVTIDAYRADTPNGNLYATGGMSNAKVFSQVYGKFAVRFRMDKGYGIAYTIQLWPTDDSWPPEIDFAEDNGKNRDKTYSTLHYGSDNTLVGRDVKGDFTTWHVAEVEWAPGKLIYRLDGKEWGTVVDKNVPNTPMSIAIQSQAWQCGLTFERCPNATTPQRVDFQIDWVVAYSATR